MHKISRLRKITSIVLAVLIAFSCVAVGVSAASTDTVKVAFTNNYDWENVYIYAYGTNNDGLMGNWPGRRLTISEDNGLGHRNYYTEVPKNTYGIVFNNGSNEKQTVDIAFSGNTTGWWVDGIESNGKYTVQEWNYQPDAPTPEPTTAPEGYLRAVFTNNNNWSSVHAYGWDADGVVTLGDWPGKAMTNLGDNGYGHDNYEVFVPASTVGIVFSDENGQQQTVDIEFEPNKGWYLDGGQNSGLYTVASWDYVEPTTATQGTTVEPTTEVIPDGTVKIVTRATITSQATGRESQWQRWAQTATAMTTTMLMFPKTQPVSYSRTAATTRLLTFPLRQTRAGISQVSRTACTQ